MKSTLELIKGEEFNLNKKLQSELKQVKKNYQILKHDLEILDANNSHLKSLIHQKDCDLVVFILITFK